MFVEWSLNLLPPPMSGLLYPCLFLHYEHTLGCRYAMVWCSWRPPCCYHLFSSLSCVAFVGFHLYLHLLSPASPLMGGLGGTAASPPRALLSPSLHLAVAGAGFHVCRWPARMAAVGLVFLPLSWCFVAVAGSTSGSLGARSGNVVAGSGGLVGPAGFSMRKWWRPCGSAVQLVTEVAGAKVGGGCGFNGAEVRQRRLLGLHHVALLLVGVSGARQGGWGRARGRGRASEAMDATEGVVLMLGWQRPGMLAEVVQLCKGLLDL